MAKSFGEIVPVNGRWVWPFAMMEEGDWFECSKLRRDPEKLRHMTHVRGSQLGVQFKFEKTSPANPVNVRVTRVGFGEQDDGAVELAIRYDVMRDLIAQVYGFNADDLPWTILRRGESHEKLAQRHEDVPRELFYVQVPDQWRFAVELLPDRVRHTRLEDGETMKSWIAKRQSLADVLD